MENINALQFQLNKLEEENKRLIQRVKTLEKLTDKPEVVQTTIQQNELRLQLAIELTDLGTWEWNPINGNLFWSQECRNIYGVSADQEITFELFTELTHPDDRSRVLQVIAETMASQEGIYDITNRIVRYDNKTVRWIKVKGKVDFNEAHKPILFMGTVIDFTENKKTQERILSGERLFKSIALNIPNSLIIVVDKDHRFLTIEGDIMERMGYDSKVLIGKHPTEIGPGDKYESTKELYNRVLSGEKFSVERKSDKGEDFMVHFVPLKDENDEVEAGLIIALDITEIKSAEEKNAKLAAIIESTDDAIISKTLESIITSWNDSAERIFGYNAEEMIGESILKLIPPDRQHEETFILSRLSKGERVEHFETKRLKKDGTLFDVSLTISPIKDSHGNIIGLSKIARDITERKQEEQRKNDFVAIVSHELKTPLTSILGYVQLLINKSKKEGNDFNINILSKAENQAQKMTSMIQEFLNLAKMEEGKFKIQLCEFNLRELITEISSDPQFNSSRHEIEIDVDELMIVKADRDKMGQVFSNLLSNAIKYSPKGGKITFASERQGQKVKVSVTDNGIGINPSDQKRLFDRFYRANHEVIKLVSGFGIGLYFTSEILKYHQSSIGVISEEGKGATFHFLLDLA